MTYVIALPCVDLKDRACIDECPVDCIYEGDRMLYIHPDECVDCGACEPVCPVEAIYYEDDLPDQWADYYKANVEFFDEIGSPGGAAKVGVIAGDHPVDRGAAAAGRALSAPALTAAAPPRLPLGLAACRSRERARGSIPTASSISRSARRSIRRPQRDPRCARRGDRRARLPADRRHRPRCARRSSTGTRRRHGVDLGVANVMPTIGSKELIGLHADAARPRPGRRRRAPDRSPTRPTRSARPSSARPSLASDDPDEWPADDAAGLAQQPRQPRRPRAGTIEHLRAPRSRRARELGAVIANDECYAELNWDGRRAPTPDDPRPAGDRRQRAG